MISFRLLMAALYIQALLGLVRFVAPYFGFWLDERVWQIHRLNGIAIAAAALVLFRPLPGAPSSQVRLAARFVPLLPLGVGLGLAAVRELVGPLPGTLIHMAVGVAAIELVGRAVAQHRREADRPAGSVGPGQGVAA
jgi:hypothetical protein